MMKNAKRSTLSEPQVSAEKPWRNVLWTAERRAELMEMIRNYKPLMTSVSRVRILMIGPVGAGKSSFFNSINSTFFLIQQMLNFADDYLDDAGQMEDS
ncbi:interferon-induced protein 44-like isoform X2 [Cyprinus carpio]|uniref:Interferon-induced protein 44-like isoform X2 n=1 Tax=Cyprinus carpio TaxID=7962 RepID=A0A9R0AQQ0_CYPCA|nr:interferon-induced protein 44-like isoform X2 [Cyprinus carpio]